MPDIIVRSARRDDAAELARVHVAAWRGAYAGLMTADVLDHVAASRPQMWERVTAGPERSRVWVAAASDGQILGFAALEMPSRNGDGSAELAALNVDPTAWSRGAGRALMRTALDRFREAHYCTATLWVAEGNTRARGFYERLGWRYDGSSNVHDAWGVRELHMEIPLIPTA